MSMRQGVIALFGLLLIACSDGASQAPPGRPGSGGPDVVAVVTQPVAQRSLQVDVEAVGTARANESVSVTSKTSSTVTAIPASVKTGPPTHTSPRSTGRPIAALRTRRITAAIPERRLRTA